MAGGIKLFQLLRKIYQIMGYHSSQSANQNLSCNARNLLMFFSIIQFFAISICFFLFEAKSINEHADCLYICSTCGVCATYVLTHLCEFEDILQLIDSFEKFIEKSKWKKSKESRQKRMFWSWNECNSA